MSHRITQKVMIVAFLSATFALAPLRLAGAAQKPLTMSVVGEAAHLAPNAHVIGNLNGAKPLHLDIFLKPRDPAGLAEAVNAVSNPKSSLFRHFLAKDQFGLLFGPARSTIASVRSVLASEGLSLGPTSADGLMIPVNTSAKSAQNIFQTNLVSYKIASRIAFANKSAPMVPSSIANDIQFISGLDTVDVPHPLRIPSVRTNTRIQVEPRSSGNTCSGAISGAQSYGAWLPSQLASAYGFSSAYSNDYLGSGQTIALWEAEPYLNSDVQTFEQCFGISPTINTVNVDGGPGSGAGSGESILDIDNIISLAPQATLDIYQGPTGSGLDIWSKIINDDSAKIISTSWGLCESNEGSSAIDSEKTLFDEAALNGQTIFAAAGDDGSEDCYSPSNGSLDTSLAVDDPGSQPEVTSVGGTSLSSVSPVTETVWNDCLNAGTSCASSGGAGGGGISSVWPMPSWQSGKGVTNSFSSSAPCSGGTTDCREVPDVSASADSTYGYLNYYNGSWSGSGGTSGAAPLWAAVVALASQACGTTTGLGPLNPTIYALGASSPGDFNDVTSGNNDLTNTNNGDYPATTGYDLATGWGTPTANLFQPGALCQSSSTTPPTKSAGYWMLSANGTVYAFGSAKSNLGSATGQGIAQAIAPTPDGGGYWIALSSGKVLNFGDAPNLVQNSSVQGPIVAIASTPTGQGYWMASATGQVITAGDAVSYGDASSLTLNKGIVSMVPTSDGLGYWLLGGDGGIFSYGDASFHGSAGQINPALPAGGTNSFTPNKPIVAIVATKSGNGYWMVGSDGGIFAFGDASFDGSSGQINPALPAGGTNSFTPKEPINAMVATATGHGYWMVASDGGVFAFGDAGFVGSLGGRTISSPIVGFAPA